MSGQAFPALCLAPCTWRHLPSDTKETGATELPVRAGTAGTASVYHSRICTLLVSEQNSFMDDDDDAVNLVYLNSIYDFWMIQLI